MNRISFRVFEKETNKALFEVITLLGADSNDIIDLISNLDEYNDLTQSIYSGDYFPEDIESVREISENILLSLYDICEYGIRNREGLTEMLQKSADTDDMKQIENIVNINSFLDNLPSKGL